MGEAQRPTSRIGSLTSRIGTGDAAQVDLPSPAGLERRPWWHTTRTPASSLAAAGLALLAAACAWWLHATEPRAWQAVAATAWTMQALTFGVSGLTRLRQGESLRSRHSNGSWRHL